MMQTAVNYIEKLNLIEHPEGGYYREVYRAKGTIKREALPESFKGYRAFATSIYYMLQGEQVSKFHRIQSDELWHFYAGSAMVVTILDPQGNISARRLGPSIEKEELLFYVPAGHWFASEVLDKSSFCLAGCTVAPGFDFEDFEIADRAKLLKEFPQHQSVIERLT